MSRSERQTGNNKSKKNQQMLLLIAGVVLVVVLAIAITVAVFFKQNDPQPPQTDDTSVSDSLSADPTGDSLTEETDYDKDRYQLDVTQYTSTILSQSADAGEDYVDETLFIGDSNTARYMLYNKTTLKNDIGVIGMGLQQVLTEKCVKFKGYSDRVTIPEAVKIMQPRRIVICFGTNNADGSWSADNFVKEYEKVLDALEEAYPYADVIVSAVPPVARLHENEKLNMTTIDSFNQALASMAEKRGCKFLNTSETLKDPDTGFAKTGYMMDSDGYHLSMPAVDAVFDYVRTHAYETEDRRPALTPVPDRDEPTPHTIGSEGPQTGYKPNSSSSQKEGLQIVFAVNDAAMGTLSGELEQIVPIGEVCTAVTAKPKEGYTFAYWSCTVGRIEDTTAEELAFVSPGGFDVDKVIVTANFTRSTLVTVVTNDKTLGSAGVRQDDNLYEEAEVENGESVTLCAVPKDGARFDGWYVRKNGTETRVSGETECIYKPEGSVEIIAKFYAYSNVTVKTNNDALGSAAIPSRSGNRITFKATPNAGARFAKWVIGSAEYTTADVTVDITGATTATAYFEEILYTCTATHDGNGSVSAGTAQGGAWTQVSITATPKDGFEFDYWGLSTGATSGSATFTGNLSGDLTITAHFKAKAVEPPPPPPESESQPQSESQSQPEPPPVDPTPSEPESSAQPESPAQTDPPAETPPENTGGAGAEQP